MEKLVLHQPPNRSWGTPNLSPFCAKLETYLRIAEVPYEPGPFGIRNAPKGKIPFVRIDGAFMGDSQLIIEELERRRVAEGKRALDDGLAGRERAQAHMLRRALEEALYFVGLYARWRTDEGYAAIREEFKKFVPAIALPFVRRRQHQKLHAQGTGRHTYEEAMAMGAADITAVADWLGDRPFVMGDEPRTVDCTVFAFLESTLAFPVETPIKARAREHANLTAYRKRVRDRWWPELPALAA